MPEREKTDVPGNEKRKDGRYIELRKQRSVEVETVSGQIKGNQGVPEVSVTRHEKSVGGMGTARSGVQFEANIPGKPGQDGIKKPE